MVHFDVIYNMSSKQESGSGGQLDRSVINSNMWDLQRCGGTASEDAGGMSKGSMDG